MNPDKAREVEIGAKDLPLHCPLPGAPLWARHCNRSKTIQKLQRNCLPE